MGGGQGGLMAALDRKRESGLSEVPIATVEERGATPKKTKYVP